METVISFFSWIALLGGSFLCLSGAVGLWRFPDFYSRIHAAGVTDTLGASLILAGLMLQSLLLVQQSWLVFAKLLLILIFMLLTSPTATHALAKAALHSGLRPHPESKKE